MAKPGEAARARSTKSLPEGEARSSSSEDERVVEGSASGGTGCSISPRTLRGARLVTSTVRPGHAATRPATSGAASSRCSRLSSTRRNRPSLSLSVRASYGVRPSLTAAPSEPSTAGITSAGSSIGASPTKATPSGKSPEASEARAASTARRVLPTPPVPVSVSSRTPGRANRSATSPSSRSRPTSDVAGYGSAVDAARGGTVAGGVSPACRAAPPRPGTAPSSEARASSPRFRASARALTVCG